ncbi:hypothetical protein C8R45DRAFT_1065874 [Mycena sanguinolenta]|nr:hypothetical protein C8R45DRAFT_1065874 [Mycena sanguinolenta]
MSPPPILGWTPSSPEGDVVDIAACQFTFQLDGARDDSPSMPSAEVSSPPSSMGLMTTTATETIPRPPNAFIIFRTEYARLHYTPKGARSRRDVSKSLQSGATVSRKAGDAWHLLPPDQKLYYHQLAVQAKKKHAQDYPGYQYRPRRRKMGSLRAHPTPKRRRHSPASTLCTVSDTITRSSTSSPFVEQPPLSPETLRSALVLDPAVAAKADRRRSSSVPVTFEEQNLYTSAFLPEERWERPAQTKRRSRSVTQDWAPSFQAPEPLFDPRSPQSTVFSLGLGLHPSPVRPCSPHLPVDTLDPAALFIPTQHMSPLAAVASSLANWNGELTSPRTMTTPPAAPIAPQPIRPNPPMWVGSPDTTLLYQPSPSPNVEERARSLTPLANIQWPLDSTGQYVFGTPVRWDGAAYDRLKHTNNSGNYAYEAALREYEPGLQERVHGMDYANTDFNFPGPELDFSPAAELHF